MTGRLRISWSTYGFLCTFPPSPPPCHLHCVPFCRSRGRVYISVRLDIDIPDLLFILLWYYSSLLRRPDMLDTVSSPATHDFSPRGDPRGGIEKRAGLSRQPRI